VLSEVPASDDQKARPPQWIHWGGNRFSAQELDAVRKVRSDNIHRIKQGIQSPMGRSLSQHIMLSWDDRFRKSHPKAKSATSAMRKIARCGEASLLDRMMWKVSDTAAKQGKSVEQVLAKLFHDFDDGNVTGSKTSLGMNEFVRLLEGGLRIKFRREEAHKVISRPCTPTAI
jgi:hypothetical protein